MDPTNSKHDSGEDSRREAVHLMDRKERLKGRNGHGLQAAKKVDWEILSLCSPHSSQAGRSEDEVIEDSVSNVDVGGVDQQDSFTKHSHSSLQLRRDLEDEGPQQPKSLRICSVGPGSAASWW